MAYGDYHGPDKADKGQEGGSCNRGLCQAPEAIWYNHGSYSWYCASCRHDIETDAFNKRGWDQDFRPTCGHPQFETRAMMDARTAKSGGEAAGPISADYVAALEETLRWYGENARLCRLIHSGGDVGRHALAADGGQRAKDALGSNIPQQFHSDYVNQAVADELFAARAQIGGAA